MGINLICSTGLQQFNIDICTIPDALRIHTEGIAIPTLGIYVGTNHIIRFGRRKTEGGRRHQITTTPGRHRSVKNFLQLPRGSTRAPEDRLREGNVFLHKNLCGQLATVFLLRRPIDVPIKCSRTFGHPDIAHASDVFKEFFSPVQYQRFISVLPGLIHRVLVGPDFFCILGLNLWYPSSVFVYRT